MQQTIELNGKSISISISAKAQHELGRRQSRLCAEMELYFSCLIRKQVRFKEAAACDNGVDVTDRLTVSFHPVMTEVCGKDFEGDAPPLTDFPIHNIKPYTPKWLSIDFKKGQWRGEFGY
ncbi:MAG: hypothetical protein OEZ68_14025 [Gammaproteobacteria bacterium]|nr:hypothetical protein [Gammaproteobacteria bacterium]MDH5801920.1 hypothetical protein [Gammaproteobacteria bacterium]